MNKAEFARIVREFGARNPGRLSIYIPSHCHWTVALRNERIRGWCWLCLHQIKETTDTLADLERIVMQSRKFQRWLDEMQEGGQNVHN